MVEHLTARAYPSSRIVERGIICGRHLGDGYRNRRGSELSQLPRVVESAKPAYSHSQMNALKRSCRSLIREIEKKTQRISLGGRGPEKGVPLG